jgi:KTSC domain
MKVPGPLLVVARHLGGLRDRVVFVGGMIRSLLVTDPAAGGARPTYDVDLIVDVPSGVEFYALNKTLRDQDFHEANEEGAPICRWIVEGVRVDIMPVDPAILGFSNVWYFGAHQSSLTIGAADGTIHILDAPHFCASKLEAYLGRGADDVYHHDLEDYIAAVDGRPTLLQEIMVSPSDLREFLAGETATLLAREAFVEALPGHLHADEASQSRLPLVLSRLRAIAVLASKSAALPATRSGLSPPVARPTLPRKPALPARPASPAGFEHVFLRSSNLRSASYDAATSTLTLEFNNGGVYSYDAVPQTIYAGLLMTASPGRYHYQWIKGRFDYRRLN